MFGPDETLSAFAKSKVEDHGLVPRATQHLFDGIAHGHEGSSFVVTVSYLEVYNDHLNDLLGGKKNCALRERPTGVMVEQHRHSTGMVPASGTELLLAGRLLRLLDALGRDVWTSQTGEGLTNAKSSPDRWRA